MTSQDGDDLAFGRIGAYRPRTRFSVDDRRAVEIAYEARTKPLHQAPAELPRMFSEPGDLNREVTGMARELAFQLLYRQPYCNVLERVYGLRRKRPNAG